MYNNQQTTTAVPTYNNQQTTAEPIYTTDSALVDETFFQPNTTESSFVKYTQYYTNIQYYTPTTTTSTTITTKAATTTSTTTTTATTPAASNTETNIFGTGFYFVSVL